MRFRAHLIVTLLAVVAASLDAAEPEARLTANPLIVSGTWANGEMIAQYRQVAVNICQAFQPDYLALAIEVNAYFARDEADFDRFIAAYLSIYDSLKGTPGCSQSHIYVTFQLERMKGIGASVGYSGKPQWGILAKFGAKLDLLAFTTYPEVEYSSPEHIPADYYKDILNQLPQELKSTPIVFQEMGWNSNNPISTTGSHNTFQTQVDFIKRFALLTAGLRDSGRIEFVAWAFMHDMRPTGAFDPFRSIGLRDSSGNPKGPDDNVWQAWRSFRQESVGNIEFGIGPIPRGFPGSQTADWLDMFQKVPEVASLLLAQTNWRDSVEKTGQIPQLFLDFAAARVYHQAECVYAINFFSLADPPSPSRPRRLFRRY